MMRIRLERNRLPRRDRRIARRLADDLRVLLVNLVTMRAIAELCDVEVRPMRELGEFLPPPNQRFALPSAG